MGMLAAWPYQRTAPGTSPGCARAKTAPPYKAANNTESSADPPNQRTNSAMRDVYLGDIQLSK